MVRNMEYQQKILLAVIAVLVVFALYLAITSQPQQAPVVTAPDVSAAESLLVHAMDFGKGMDTYTYSSEESSNGYWTFYNYTKSSNGEMVVFQNPLSTKAAYFLSNSTILCVNYSSSAGCADVTGNAELANYLASLQSKFFNETIIDQNKMDIEYLIAKGYVIMDPTITNGTVSGMPCSAISYTLDMSNATVDDAARFGIGTNTPTVFSWSMCVDNKTGYVLDRSFNYTYNGIAFTNDNLLLALSPGAPQIVPPSNLTGDPLTALMQERVEQVTLANCFTTKQGADRDQCIADEAINIQSKELCSLTVARKDRCLVSIVPLTKDATICQEIQDPSYKDDCYVELAGAYKNDTYCADIVNATKVPECENASMPFPAENASITGNGTAPAAPQNGTSMNGSAGNMTISSPPLNGSAKNQSTNSSFNATKFLQYIDTYGENGTSGNASNGTTNSSSG